MGFAREHQQVNQPEERLRLAAHLSRSVGSRFLCGWQVPGKFCSLSVKGKPEAVHDAISERLAFSKIWAIL